jgi:hypothetical protein
MNCRLAVQQSGVALRGPSMVCDPDKPCVHRMETFTRIPDINSEATLWPESHLFDSVSRVQYEGWNVLEPWSFLTYRVLKITAFRQRVNSVGPISFSEP